MPDLGLFVLIVVAIAIGWALGRFSRSGNDEPEEDTLPVSYYKGLNYLINEQPDQAVETFVNTLEVNPITMDTHLALGNLMRRRGEVDRAIRIHQNLLARPTLTSEQQHSAHLELARDYLKAGLLDRAERLLEDLVKESPDRKTEALNHLLEIFEEEREWEDAIRIGEQLLPKRLLKQRTQQQEEVASRMAHYCCELAQGAIDQEQYRDAQQQLKRAMGYDRECVRASLLEAEVLFHQGNVRRAIKSLERIAVQNPHFIIVALPMLSRCYEHQGDLSGLHRFLREFLKQHQSMGVVTKIADDLNAQGSHDQAVLLLEHVLAEHPNIKGMNRLIDLQLSTVDESSRANLVNLQSLLKRQLDYSPAYRCNSCGFPGAQLHWHCPSCKHWGSMEPIRGLDGD